MHVAGAVSVQLEAQPLALGAGRSVLPIETISKADCRESSLGIQRSSERAPPMIWQDPDGTPLPFQNDSEILEFLRTARIVSRNR